MDSNLLVKIRNLKAGYVKGSNVLNGVDLDINQQEIVAVVGQNGSGKSTLAKAIMRITPYTEGSIQFLGNEILNEAYAPDDIFRRGLGYFIQEGVVFNNLTVEENLVFSGRLLDKILRFKRIENMREYFELFRESKRFRMKANYLSGGEKHQLALAMVLMSNPKLLILDEPSAGLSPINRKSMFETIKRLNVELSIGILLVEQNIQEALNVADKIGLMQLGQLSNDLDHKAILNAIGFGQDE